MKKNIPHARKHTGPGGNRSNEQGMTIESPEQPGNSYHLTLHRSFIKTVPVQRSISVRTCAIKMVRVINGKKNLTG